MPVTSEFAASQFCGFPSDLPMISRTLGESEVEDHYSSHAWWVCRAQQDLGGVLPCSITSGFPHADQTSVHTRRQPSLTLGLHRGFSPASMKLRNTS